MNKKREENDPLGKACLDFLDGKVGLTPEEQIIVFCNKAQRDIIPIKYLFRSFYKMPEVEQEALKKARGTILIIGAGAGCHSLWLQNRGMDVTSVEISSGAVEAMRRIGVKNVLHKDLYDLPNDTKYDTIIALMNGIGIAGTLKNLPVFLAKIKSLLNPNGQFLADSTDLEELIYEDGLEEYYLFDGEEDYVGELEYRMLYEEVYSDWFEWLYIDFEKLNKIARSVGLRTEKICGDDSPEYLVRMIQV